MSEEFELDFETIQKLRLDATKKLRTQANIVDGDVVESPSEETDGE